MKTLLSLCIISAVGGCARSSDGGSGSSHAQPPLPKLDKADLIRGIGEVEKNALGNPIRVRYQAAFGLCRKKGSRLPTIREYAILATALGAKGTRETTYPDVSIEDPRINGETGLNELEGFFPLYRRSSSGEKVVAFYFNEGGQSKSGDEDLDGGGTYWSSPVPVDPDNADGAYAFNHSGFVAIDLRAMDTFEVRCAVMD
jgi:hypothetical protein